MGGGGVSVVHIGRNERLLCYHYLGVSCWILSQTVPGVIYQYHIYNFIVGVIVYHEVSDSFADFTYLSTNIGEEGISRSSTNNHDIFCIYALY